jgi:FkbM family methyltransferase
MTFVSHAQNFEDVMLWRALRGVKEGFYIDVGAGDPDLHSVTKIFYVHGWHGINVEPLRTTYKKLQVDRPRDINLCVAAGEERGATTLYEIVRTGLSTTTKSVADQYRLNSYESAPSRVERRTLTDVCEQFVKGHIHFAKMDVAGAEKGVLAGFDLTRWRPWILVIKAMVPLSQAENHQEWEAMVLSADYTFAYADGLNRFYIARERSEQLLKAFQYPPNVFDDFVQNAAVLGRELVHTETAEQRAEQGGQRPAREQRIASTRLEVSSQRQLAERLQRLLDEEIARSAALADRLASREDLLVATYRSRSWRVTAPLRRLAIARQRRRRRQLAAPLQDRIDRGPDRPTIFIECTHTFHSDLNSGIQRVVRNVLRNAEAVASNYGYAVVPVMLEGNRFLAADVNVVLSDKLLKPHAAPPTTAPTAPHPLDRVPQRRRIHGTLRSVWRGSWHWAVRFLNALAKRLGLSRRASRLQQISAISAAHRPFELDDRPFCKTDILLLLDSSWTTQIWPGVQRFKRRGGRVIGVIYDIIPITHSYTSVPELVDAFRAWLHSHARYTDTFIAISRSVAQQVSDYMASAGKDGASLTTVPISYFHLGSELDFASNAPEIRQIVSNIFERRDHVFLVVGSIEPRKKHAFILDAFDRLWEAGGRASLVIIGRHGWKTDDFLERVVRHEHLGQRLFLLRDATDSELDYAYRNASALVIASEIEGFGLPIVEAFQRGLPVLCSDIPVFREIADGRAVFFSLDDPNHLLAAVLNYCHVHDPACRRNRTPQSWLTWRESTEQLFAAMLQGEAHTMDFANPAQQQVTSIADTTSDSSRPDDGESDVNRVEAL